MGAKVAHFIFIVSELVDCGCGFGVEEFDLGFEVLDADLSLGGEGGYVVAAGGAGGGC